MPPKKLAGRGRGGKRAGGDERAARARGNAPSPGRAVGSSSPVNVESPTPAGPSTSGLGAREVTGHATTTGRSRSAEGAARNERNYTPTPINPADRGRNGRVAGRSLISWGRKLRLR
jgi:hypothetical protein